MGLTLHQVNSAVEESSEGAAIVAQSLCRAMRRPTVDLHAVAAASEETATRIAKQLDANEIIVSDALFSLFTRVSLAARTVLLMATLAANTHDSLSAALTGCADRISPLHVLSPACFAALSSNPALDTFWPYIYACLLRMHHRAAVSMLLTHEHSISRKTNNPFHALINAINDMPSDSLDENWKKWKRSVEPFSRLERLQSVFNTPTTTYPDLPNLATAFGILAANPQSLGTAALAVSSVDPDPSTNMPWFDATIAHLSYSLPSSQTIQSIQSHVDALRAHLDVPEFGEDLIDAGKMPETIRETYLAALISVLYLDWDACVLKYLTRLHHGISVHVVYALDKVVRMDPDFNVPVYFPTRDAEVVVGAFAGVRTGTNVKDEELQQVLSMRDLYLLEYAEWVAEIDQGKLWVIAVEYLSAVQVQAVARRVIIEILTRVVDCTSFWRDTARILAVAKRFGGDVEREVLGHACAVKGRRFEGQIGRECLAIVEYIRGGYLERGRRVVEKIVDLYVAPGRISSNEIEGSKKEEGVNWKQRVLQLPGDVVEADVHVAFLYKLVEFMQAYTHKDVKVHRHEAGAALIELISRFPKHVVPSRILCGLVVDSVPLLECKDECVLGVNETYEILRVLEDIAGDGCGWNGRGVVGTPWGGDATVERGLEQFVSVEVVRLAVSRNLARALMVAA